MHIICFVIKYLIYCVADIESTELLQKLEAGERLKKLDQCPSGIYDLMALCWSGAPDQRPAFTKVKMALTHCTQNERPDT